MGLGPPGKAMTLRHGGEDLAPEVRGNNPQGGLPPGYMGEAAPSLQGRETLATGESNALPIGRGGKIVFVDFGRSKVFALTDDGDEVLVFNNLVELVERLRPAVIVLDNLPGKRQSAAVELAKTGITFLRLKDLKKLSEERKNNGVQKSDKNDVVVLKMLFRRNPDDFQPLFTTLEELLVRELTEEWATFTLMKKVAKQKRTTTNHPLAIKAHKTLQNIVDKFSEEIHREAMKLPLYRLTFERFGLMGPALAYLISHDGWALNTLPREKLILRFQMTGRRKHRKRNTRSRLLIMLAMSAVLHKHSTYYQVYQRYFGRFKAEGYSGKQAQWKAILRVAERILRDLHSLAKNTKQTPDT
jgi:IS1 family transposase